MTTSNTYLAAWIDSCGIPPFHVDSVAVPRRYYFHDLEKVRELEKVWKSYTGGKYRESYKRLNRKQ